MQDALQHEDSVAARAGAFPYDSQSNFSEPVKVRGATRVLHLNPILKTMDTDEKKAAFLNASVALEQSTRVSEVGLVTNLVLRYVCSEYLLLSTETSPENLFYIHIDPKEKSYPLSQLSAILGIPYQFAKKNPGYLNSPTFAHYIDKLKAKERLPSVRLLYLNRPINVSMEVMMDIDDAGNLKPEPTMEFVPVRAYPLVAVLSHKDSSVVCSMDASSDGVIAKQSMVVKSILNNPALQQYDLKLMRAFSTITPENGGNQFHSIISTAFNTQVDVGGEVYSPVLNVTSRLFERSQTPTIQLDFGLMRMVCENGLMLPMHQNVFEQMGDIFTESEKALLPGVTSSNNGVTLPANIFNSRLGLKIINGIMESLVEQAHVMSHALARAAEFQLITSNPEEFIKAATDLGSSMKVSGKVIEMFLMEYLAGQLSGEQKFKTPFDCIQFITFVSRAYDTAIIAKTEQVAYSYAMQLYRNLAEGSKQVSYVESLRSKMAKPYQEL